MTKDIKTSQSTGDPVSGPRLDETFIKLQNELDALREILNFREIHKDNTVRVVVDDILCPTYEPGDYVGGRRCYDQTIPQAVNNNCIVETEDGATYVRRVTKGRKNGTFNLSCINPTTKLPEYTIFSVNLKSAAPILWHRKLPA